MCITPIFLPADIDECALGTDNCSDNANCSDTIGSYDCTCRTGFDGNGILCEGIINTSRFAASFILYSMEYGSVTVHIHNKHSSNL